MRQAQGRDRRRVRIVIIDDADDAIDAIDVIAIIDAIVIAVVKVVTAVVVIGVDQEPWKSALASIDVPVTYIDPASPEPMDDAVAAARSHARRGDVVLLAPACASMDQFASYAERGERFAEAARRNDGPH